MALLTLRLHVRFCAQTKEHANNLWPADLQALGHVRGVQHAALEMLCFCFNELLAHFQTSADRGSSLRFFAGTRSDCSVAEVLASSCCLICPVEFLNKTILLEIELSSLVFRSLLDCSTEVFPSVGQFG